jgi:hypothetical protein
MKPVRREEYSRRSGVTSRTAGVLVALLALSVMAGVTIALVLHWRRVPPDPYFGLPFRPKVSYEGSHLTVVNTEKEPYLDTQLTLFVGWTSCRVRLGTILPGKEVRVPLSSFAYDDGKLFDPVKTKAKLLEVRATMNGYEVHRDLPPPQ